MSRNSLEITAAALAAILMIEVTAFAVFFISAQDTTSATSQPDIRFEMQMRERSMW